MEQRIILAVERVGVGSVFGEADRRGGVTLLARGQDVGPGQPRGWVGGRQHVVMAVAVVAGGDVGGDVWLAEGHGFAVVGVAIMLQPILVAFPAPLVAQHLKVAVLRGLDFVRSVAIAADRATLVAFGEELAVDALQVGLFDANVAFAAGLGDIDVVDRRFAVHRPFDVVDAVAVIAGGSDDEAHLEQGTPVNAVHVLCRRLGILHLVFLRQPRIAVALGAGPGQVQLEDRRLGVFVGEHVVRAVTIPATGGSGGANLVAHAMHAHRVFFDGPLVAFDATGRLHRHIVVRMLGSDVRVAIRAGIGLVDGGLKSGLIDEQGDFLAGGVGLGERLVRMTFQAGAVGALVRGPGWQRSGHAPHQENQGDAHKCRSVYLSTTRR